jgi:hypothetical protein
MKNVSHNTCSFSRRVHTSEGGKGIQTSDLRFIRHSIQPIKLSLGAPTVEEVNISNGHELIEKDDIPNLQR